MPHECVAFDESNRGARVERTGGDREWREQIGLTRLIGWRRYRARIAGRRVVLLAATRASSDWRGAAGSARALSVEGEPSISRSRRGRFDVRRRVALEDLHLTPARCGTAHRSGSHAQVPAGTTLMPAHQVATRLLPLPAWHVSTPSRASDPSPSTACAS